jgi:hypothetical protein
MNHPMDYISSYDYIVDSVKTIDASRRINLGLKPDTKNIDYVLNNGFLLSPCILCDLCVLSRKYFQPRF